MNLRSRAISTALGAWIGVTVWKASLAGVIAACIGFSLFTPPGRAVMLTLGGILVLLLLWLPDPLLFFVWASEILILAWTYRSDLSIPLRLAFLYPFTLRAIEVVANQSLRLSLAGRLTWKGRTLAQPRSRWFKSHGCAP